MKMTQQFSIREVASWGPFTIDHTFEDEVCGQAWLAVCHGDSTAVTATPKSYTIEFIQTDLGWDTNGSPLMQDASQKPGPGVIVSVTFTMEDNNNA
jgi:hypothetical protein